MSTPKHETVTMRKSLVQNVANPMQIVEPDMKEAIATEDGESADFAHCNSGDFENEKQMSRGVAVAFRKVFGNVRTA